jgi:hypothetical protein
VSFNYNVTPVNREQFKGILDFVNANGGIIEEEKGKYKIGNLALSQSLAALLLENYEWMNKKDTELPVMTIHKRPSA